MSDQRNQPLDILFVVGAGRSGTTLLDLLLGQVPGFFSCGEIIYIWSRGMQENQLCGCGSPFRECPFWREVAQRAFGGMEQVDLEHVERLIQGVHVNRYAPWARLWREPHRRALEYYGGVLGRLFHSIREVSGARYIIDSSKEPLQGPALHAIPGARIHKIHLVRDARAVAHSWQRKRIRTEITWKKTEMNVYPHWKSALHWDKRMVQARATRLLGGTWQTVRYEDLVTDPGPTLRQILSRLGEAPGDLSFIDGNTAHLKPNHTVAGNPMRFHHGPLTIKPDSEWRERMPTRGKGLVTALCWPFLARHRYL